MSKINIELNASDQAERSAVLCYLYQRFWAIAAFHRAGRFQGEAEAAALVEQRMICIMFEDFAQGLHELPSEIAQAGAI